MMIFSCDFVLLVLHGGIIVVEESMETNLGCFLHVLNNLFKNHELIYLLWYVHIMIWH